MFAAKAEELKIEIMEALGTENHMHVILKSPPTLAASDIAKELSAYKFSFIVLDKANKADYISTKFMLAVDIEKNLELAFSDLPENIITNLPILVFSNYQSIRHH